MHGVRGNIPVNSLFLFGFSLLGFHPCGMRFPALGTLLGFPDHDIISVSAGDCAPDQKEIVCFAHLNHLEVLGCATDLAHVAWHFHAPHNGTWKESLPDGTRSPMP